MHRDIVAKVPLLQPLTARAVFAIARVWKKLVYLPNDEIVSEGDSVDSLYFVVRGLVGITYNAGLGASKKSLIDLQEGGFFGEECSEECKRAAQRMEGIEKGKQVKVMESGSVARASRRESVLDLSSFVFTATSLSYTELLSVSRETYAEVALSFKEILVHVNSVLGE
jgi:CRP-like cAMP-binding protein